MYIVFYIHIYNILDCKVSVEILMCLISKFSARYDS